MVKWQNGNAPAISNLFDEFFNKDPFESLIRRNVASTAPAINIRETDTLYQLEVAAPGLSKEDFNIEIDDNNRLTISSEQKSETENNSEEGRYTRKEFSYSAMRRSFVLPDTVDNEKIEATCKDGVLLLSIPKNEKSSGPNTRMIEIK